MPNTTRFHRLWEQELALPIGLAVFQFALVMAFSWRYDYFRDELYYIACTKHLALGYVDQPPLSILILWLNRLILGDSLCALRCLPALAGAVVVVMAALTARRLGAARFGQGLAALAVIAAHGLIGHGKMFSMNPFDVLFWTLAGYVVIEIVLANKPRLWPLFGVIVGLGVLNKYSMGFMVIGLMVGLLMTSQRSQLGSGWFWLGVALACFIMAPHILWEIRRGLPSLEFMRNASMLKNVRLSAGAFLLGQVRDMNVVNSLLWAGGIGFFFFKLHGRLRFLGWMFVIVFSIMVLGHAKIYYLSAIFPLYLAAGAVLFEQWPWGHACAWSDRSSPAH
jgi:4-amino-4-deoxy-L-arabinose transferase-like glycosyltransferase